MNRDINDIIIDILTGTPLSAEEQSLFDGWMTEPGNRRYYDEFLRVRSALKAVRSEEQVNSSRAWGKVSGAVSRRRLIRYAVRYAAVILLFLSVGGAFWGLRQTKSTSLPLAQEVVVPGKKQAVLTLSSGEKINLSDNLSTSIRKEQGVEILTSNENVLVYNKSGEVGMAVYNAISVPRGGEYVLTLADGTMVWLNSDSQIRYPISFEGTTREVFLQGEAYFDVAKNAGKPFIVHTEKFDVRVTGTQFNVHIYSDEIESTTLVEGSVQLEQGNNVNKLLPGEQAQLIGEQMVVKKVNVEDQIAWRNGAFCFKEQKLESIMNELSRWYDVEVFYQNAVVRDYHFSAWFSRNSSIEEVISILEKTQKIKMRLKGKVLTIETI